MRSALLVILLISAHSIGSPNYQQRRIYYNQTDNVCLFHEQSDQPLLVITFSDRPQIRKLIRGQTGCDRTAHKFYNQLEPSDIMCLTQHSSQACFKQITTVRRITDLVLAVDQNVTVINPVSFDDIFYNCTIEGDGTIQHFGPVNVLKPQIPAPQLNMYCTRTYSSEQK